MGKCYRKDLIDIDSAGAKTVYNIFEKNIYYYKFKPFNVSMHWNCLFKTSLMSIHFIWFRQT